MNTVALERSVYSGFPETFESGSKTAYAVASVTLSTGSWTLDDALIGTSTSDRKNAAKSVRIEYTGTVTMNFDVTNGAFSCYHCTWCLWHRCFKHMAIMVLYERRQHLYPSRQLHYYFFYHIGYCKFHPERERQTSVSSCAN